jgi:ABC-type enterobactin transport system permease subunit
VTEFLNDIFGLGFFFGPSITAFALVTFSPLRGLRQPARMIMVGIASGAVAVFFSIPGKLRGNISSARAVLIGVGIAMVVRALISLLGSSETIGEKRRDEMIRKGDDQSWRF